jgi:RimJ/RimL family protein N-acetyltransferase
MIEITPRQITDNLRTLFPRATPNPLRCFAILEGRAVGRILTDDPVHPRWAAVQALADGTLYLGGRFEAPVLAELVRDLRKTSEVVILLWPDDPRLALLPPDPDYVGVAIDFTQRANAQDEWPLRPSPEGCHLQRMDAALHRRSNSYDWNVATFGSAERALEQGLGFCLLRDETIVCEAFAGPAALGMIELGVGTHEAYRGRGFATYTCLHLVQECERLGYQTFWNAAQQNLASVALARRLGYQVEHELSVLAWSQCDP